MDGVSTSRQAMVDSAGVLGGQLWSPIWSGEAGDDQGRRGGGVGERRASPERSDGRL